MFIDLRIFEQEAMLSESVQPEFGAVRGLAQFVTSP